MKRLFISILTISTFLFSTSLFIEKVYAQKINYQQWEKILNTYVDDNGRVNYKGLKENRKILDDFIKNQIESVDISSFSDNEKKAFWINAYNALTMRLIVDNYPIRFGGIKTINWGRPWSVKMKAAKRELTLSQIEHEILREWDPIDPRIHFAINCASIGCPKLPNTHFSPDTLDQQLDNETRKFMNDTEKSKLDRSKNILYHSAILNWFEEDFVANNPDKLTFILKYLNEEPKQYILSHKDQIRLKEMKYDWNLNKQQSK